MTTAGRRRSRDPLRGSRIPVLASALLAVLSAGCSSPTPEIVVGGDDYAFLLGEPVPSGTVQFGFDNRGEVRHELVLVQLAEGSTLADLAAAAQSGAEAFDHITAVGGVLIAEPRQKAWGSLRVDLESGRTYALLCNFKDTEDAKPHTELGMVKEFVAQ